MKASFAIAFFMLTGLLAIPVAFAQKPARLPENEVIYHVVQRSFFDGNGDGHGDFKGLQSKLDYLQELGITSILTLPIFESVYYHNYFSSNFEKIDPKFGTLDDWCRLIEDLHRRNMKIYLDLEFQYVTEDHIWYKDSYGKPKSPYDALMVYNKEGNLEPEPIIFNLTELMGYDSSKRRITTINLKAPEALTYFTKLLSFWADPNGDGNLEDGVDGYRLDHMMDELDDKPKFNNLFTEFWKPLISNTKIKYPSLIFIAEQANWANYGEDYFARGGVDRVFAFNLRNAIAGFEKKKILAVADTMFSRTPPGKQQVVFLENHDMIRFASAVQGNPGKARAAAALQLLLGGIPSIYYGQELGMRGEGGFGKFGVSDGNDIPYREAYEWYAADSGKGMALWYKNTGPWWTQTNLKPGDGISVEEQDKDQNSLLNTYRNLLALRKKHPVLAGGRYLSCTNNHPQVISFLRQTGPNTYLVLVNLSEFESEVLTQLPKGLFLPAGNYASIFGEGKAKLNKNQTVKFKMRAYGANAFRLR